MIHLDSSFLVDLLREIVRKKPGAAAAFLSDAMEEELRVSVFVACELFAGAELSSKPGQEAERVRQLFAALQIVYPDERFAPLYGRLLAAQERGRQRISTMDLLIATTAVLDEAPLVTRNLRDFSRIPGLRLLNY